MNPNMHSVVYLGNIQKMFKCCLPISRLYSLLFRKLCFIVVGTVLCQNVVKICKVKAEMAMRLHESKEKVLSKEMKWRLT